MYPPILTKGSGFGSVDKTRAVMRKDTREEERHEREENTHRERQEGRDKVKRLSE